VEAREVDGLTIEQLRTSRAYWWDEHFTRVPPGGPLVLRRATRRRRPRLRRAAGRAATAAEVAATLGRAAEAIAASAAAARCAARAEACAAAVDAWLEQVGPQATGQHTWFVPVFVTRGSR
jgi:hypothetical protein